MKRYFPLAAFAALVFWAGCDAASPLESEPPRQSETKTRTTPGVISLEVEDLAAFDDLILFESDAGKGIKYACSFATVNPNNGRVRSGTKKVKIPKSLGDPGGRRVVTFRLNSKNGTTVYRMARCVIPDDDAVQEWLLLKLHPAKYRHLTTSRRPGKSMGWEMECVQTGYGDPPEVECDTWYEEDPPDGDILGDPDSPDWPDTGSSGGPGGPPPGGDPGDNDPAGDDDEYDDPPDNTSPPDCSLNYNPQTHPDHIGWCNGTRPTDDQDAKMRQAINNLKNMGPEICTTGANLALAILTNDGFRVADPNTYDAGGGAPTFADAYSQADWFVLHPNWFAWLGQRSGDHPSLQGAIMHEMDHILNQVGSETDSDGHLTGTNPKRTMHQQMCDIQ